MDHREPPSRSRPQTARTDPKGLDVGDAAANAVVEGGAELVHGETCREVDQRPGVRRDRYPLDDAVLGGEEGLRPWVEMRLILRRSGLAVLISTDPGPTFGNWWRYAADSCEATAPGPAAITAAQMRCSKLNGEPATA